MGGSSAKRIQTSVLAAAEKKLLVKIAGRLPRWVTSDMLTWTGFVGAVVCAAGFALAELNLNWLWLSSGGLFINWFGDSLDGTVARVRNTQRPTYGFYIDHALDAFTISIMCIGAGLAPMFNINIGLLALAGYLVLSIHTYLLTILQDEFRLTYSGLGPTEFRLIIVIVNTVAIYVPWQRCNLTICGVESNVFELIGTAIVAILWIIAIWQFRSGLIFFGKKDPAQPYNPSKKD